MPGGGKGPSSSGTVTQTTQNPTQQAQLPFLTGQAVQSANQPGFNTPAGFNEALQLNETNPLQYFPGQTLANQNPAMAQGYNDLINTAQSVDQTLRPAGNNIFFNAADGGMSGANSPAAGALGTIASGQAAPQGLLSGQVNQLNRLADYSSSAAGGPQTELQGLEQKGTGAQPVWENLSGLASGAASNPYATALTQQAQSGGINGLPTAYGGLSGEAQGQFLGKNPYLDSEFNAAARSVGNAYQTDVVPGINSNSEAAGRYGSGAQANALSIAQQNLGKTLGDMGANLYGQDYANERGLMQNAQGELGNLGLSEFGARTGALNQAGNQFLGGIGAATGANSAAGGLIQNDANFRTNAIGEGANLYNQALSTAGNLVSAGANPAGSLLSSELGGANTLQSAFDAGNRNSLIGLGMEPSVMSQNYAPAQQMTAGGQGLTSLEQQQINDQQNRFYGQIQAPWQQATQYMNLIGNPQTGSSGTTTPILGPNGFSSALGTLGSLGSLGNNLGLFGGGGLFGSGAAGGLGADALTGAASSAGFDTLGSTVGMGALGGDFGGGAAGKGLASALPFL